MPKGYLKEIEEIPYPEEHLEDLKRAGPLMVSAIERDGPPIESGSINLGKVDKQLDVALFFFYWIAETNEIIENLNIILSDMRSLPTNYILLKGSPKTRYYLLIRTYFHEFYRFRETHHQVVKAAADRGYIKRNEVPELRKAFHDAFESNIKLRNNLVHGSPVWKGKKHLDLTLMASAWEEGMAIKDIETGEIWDIGTLLQDICREMADILRDEGNRMSNLLQALVRIYVGLAAKV